MLSFVSPSIVKQFLTPFFNNIGVGVSLTLFQTLLCSSHYNELFIHKDVIINNFLLTSFTYGYDRLRDAIQYSFQKNKEDYSLSKQNLYNSILKYQNFYSIFYHLLFIIIYMRLNFHNEKFVIFSILTFTTIFYKDLKEKLSILKPFYISFMWILAGYILPILWQDGYLDINLYKQEILSYFILFFSMTNLLDINDYHEDKMNKIYTIPVLLGLEQSKFLNDLIFIGSIYSLNQNMNYFNLFLIITNMIFYLKDVFISEMNKLK